jgi:hypothetical protein
MKLPKKEKILPLKKLLKVILSKKNKKYIIKLIILKDYGLNVKITRT